MQKEETTQPVTVDETQQKESTVTNIESTVDDLNEQKPDIHNTEDGVLETAENQVDETPVSELETVAITDSTELNTPAEEITPVVENVVEPVINDSTIPTQENETPGAALQPDNKLETEETAPEAETETADTTATAETVMQDIQETQSVPDTDVESLELMDEAVDDHDESEVETAYNIGAAHVEETDFSALSKEQLVDLIESVTGDEDLQEAFRVAKEVKTYLERIINEEQEQALLAFLEAGNEKDDFSPKPDEFRQRFFAAYKKIQTRRADNRNRLEEEKQKNLHTKKNILEKLKQLTENDETSDSLDKVKELQNEWKKIRAVPKEFMQELWDSYRFYQDKFYDNLSINNELKELDRKKNLEAKIDLCMKVDQLQEEASIKKALNMLNKYHDEWKHTGPVPREYSDEIWSRFKAASDKIFEQKKGLLDELNAERDKNFELKTALVEKLEMAVAVEPDKPKEWIAKTQAINEVFEEWKKIGPVPNEHNESIWKKFKELRNTFFRMKTQYFKNLNKIKTDNLALKYEICEKAESLKDSDDWMKTTNELIRLQNEWKKIGQVPDKQSEEIWKRFRAACDGFFARKEENFKGQKEDQKQSLEIKKALLEQLKALEAKEEGEQVMNELKEIQKSWSNAGFVPIKFKNELQQQYSNLLDVVYKKFRRNTEVLTEGKMKEHYGEIAHADEGKKRLQMEERRIKEKIRFLRSDMETLENNIGFFSNSKTAGPLIAGINEKIKKSNQQVEKLEKELSVIKKLL